MGGYLDPNYLANMYANNAVVAGQTAAAGMYPVAGGAGYDIMGDSIFSGMGCNMGCGMNYPMNFGGAYGFGGPGSEVMGMSQMDYMRYQEDLEDFQLQKSLRQKKKFASANYQANAVQSQIKSQIHTLAGKIHDNDQDNVSVEYGKLKKLVQDHLANQGIEGIEEDSTLLNGYVNDMYYNEIQQSITDDLKQYGDSNFFHGFKQGLFGLGWLFTSDKTVDDSLKTATGANPKKGAKAKQILGMITAGILTGGLTILGCKTKGFTKLFKSTAEVAT